MAQTIQEYCCSSEDPAERQNNRFNYSQTFEAKHSVRRAPFIKKRATKTVTEGKKALNDFCRNEFRMNLPLSLWCRFLAWDRHRDLVI